MEKLELDQLDQLDQVEPSIIVIKNIAKIILKDDVLENLEALIQFYELSLESFNEILESNEDVSFDFCKEMRDINKSKEEFLEMRFVKAIAEEIARDVARKSVKETVGSYALKIENDLKI